MIVVNPKEGKDLTNSSCRPMALKYRSKNITNNSRGAEKVLPLKIENDRCGVVSNRYLADNIRRTLKIMDQYQKENKTLLQTSS